MRSGSMSLQQHFSRSGPIRSVTVPDVEARVLAFWVALAGRFLIADVRTMWKLLTSSTRSNIAAKIVALA